MSKVSEILQKYSSKCPTVTLKCREILAPLGNIIVVADDAFVYLISFVDKYNLEKRIKFLANLFKCDFVENNCKPITILEIQLKDYFHGILKEFSVPYKLLGTDFQKETWTQLMKIPYGETKTYGEQAVVLGRNASHSRAVGSACGANMLAILVPCHRLVAGNEVKGGYSGGLDKKKWLLQHESSHK